ncbi:MAG: LamG-like jellyroll fold domain-containing protein, partial [Bacteroidota bacterium]
MKKLLFLSYFLLVTVVTINAQCWQTLASGSLHSLAIKGDGTLWAWGFNSYGELGDNTTTNKSTPVQIGSATNWKTVSIGQYHSMGIKTDGTLWAWGSNSNGQLGDGTTVSKLVPVQIGTDNNWFYISLNSNHSIAIKTDGTMWGCGLNSTSQLGDGTSIDKNAFIQIGTATNWISASSGYDFTMAIQTNGTLWGFGSNNFSKLGDGTTTLRSTPVQIGTATNWSVAASGQIHSIALKTDGTLWSWGYSSNTGNLGLGAVTTQPNPAQIGTATNWKAVAAGYRHSLATKTDGTLWAFGYNNNGQLGDGTTTDRNIPTQVGTGTNWLYPKAGSFFSSGIQSNNTIWCSGASSSGQLGDGTTVGKTSFVQALTACTAGAALNFDGANDKVALGAFSINGAASRTVEFWIKTSITGGFQNPFSSGTANNSQAFNIKVTPTGHLGFMGFNNDNYPSTGTVIADNTYHHVALTYNGANVKAYIDGNLEWTFVTTLATTGTNNYIGASNHAGNEQYFLGTIDELRVWNVARTQCEINIYKNCEIPATSVGLLANYHFNQGLDASPNPTETLLTDGAGSAYSGTLTTFALTGTTSNWVAPGGVVSGYTTTTITTPTVTVNSGSVTSGASFTMTPAGGVSYTYLPSGPIVTPSTSSTYTVTGTTAPGCTNTAISTVSVQGAALNFDGSNDFVSIGSVIPLNSSYTKEAWIYANASGSNNIISSGSAAFWLAGGKLSAFNNGGATISDPAAFPLNQWVHVAVSLNAANGVLSLFKNGVLVASGSSNTGYAADAIAIGQYGPSAANFFQGAMDEVRIWNRALCSSEIQNNMNAELPSGQTGLLSYYKMNQGFASLANPTATVLIDASGASNNAPLSNFAYAGNTSNWIAPGGVITGSTAVFFNSPISASAATTSVSCGGSATGSATITAAGGAPYTYSWSPSVGTTSVVSSLSASNYTVLVTGVCGVKIVTLSIAGPSAITTATAVTNLACNGGSNGAASINASGGTGGYTYLWSNGGTTSAITGLMAGVYTATVTDANSCTSIKSASVTQPSALVTSTAVTNVACNGGSNGVTSITASGGAGGYTYLWSNGGTTSAITGLMAGVYTAT